MPKLILLNTESDNLRELRNRLAVKGYESPLLDLRLSFNSEDQVLEYISMLKGRDRVYPEFLPTQASGRWSVKKPPLVNFPDEIRDCVCPDPGEVWIGWDLDAIEGKLVAAFSHDRDDLEAFDKRYDIHTITACRMIHMELPPDLKDPHQSPLAKEWREKHQWRGKEDKRRILAKVRYCLLYGRGAEAVQGSKYEKDMVKMGFDRSILLLAAKQFLASKPQLIACKRKYWDQCAKKSESRTIFGRRRRLFGDYWSKAKEGWNHMVQGSVTDMVNESLIELCSPRDDGQHWRLIYPSHDAAKVAVPLDYFTANRTTVLETFHTAIERWWDVDGEKIQSTATFHIYYPDGTVEHL